MTQPRPRPWGIDRRVLLALLFLALSGAALGVDVKTGNLIIADRSADPLAYGDSRGIILLADDTSPLPIRLVASPDGFVDPVASVVLPDGRILVVDSNADPLHDERNRGAIYAIDPNVTLPGRADVFARSAQFDSPVDILLEVSGSVLVLDADADLLGLGTRPGALFRVDPVSHVVTPIAASNYWSEPRSMVFDIDGKVLVWDARADPLGLGAVPGALFKVDPATGVVDLIFSFREFATPWAIALAKNGDYLLLDRDANPYGYPGAPGAVYRIRRSDHTITPAIANPEFVEPFDLTVDPSGDVFVLDQRANPFNIPSAAGAVFRCDITTGQIKKTISSGFCRALSGITQFTGTALDSSLVTWQDLTGAPLTPGDRMRVRVRARNTGMVPGRGVVMEHSLTGAWDFIPGSDSTSTGEFSYLPGTQTLTWTGDIAAGGEAEIFYEIRLREVIPPGALLHEEVILRVARAASPFILEATVASRTEQGRILWADYATAAGATKGTLSEMPTGALRPVRVFEGPPLVEPADITFLSDGSLAVLDRKAVIRGPDARPGGVFRIDLLTGGVDTLLAIDDHPELRLPLGLASYGADELIVVDKDANPRQLPGAPGAVFMLNLETRELRLIASSPLFSEPSDAIMEVTGNILMVDFDADPGGSQPHTGSLFEIDPRNGIVNAIAHPPNTFVDPVGLYEGPGRRVYVADLGANPLGLRGNTGAIFEVRRGNGNLVSVYSADSLYTDPTDLIALGDGSLIVTDREANPYDLPPGDRGAIFRVRAGGGPPRVVTADPSLFGPEAIAIYVRGNMAGSTLTVKDLNGPPGLEGDTLRFDVRLQNVGRGAVDDALVTVLLSKFLDLVDAGGAAGVVTDRNTGLISWNGDLAPLDTVRVHARARVTPGFEYGDKVFANYRVSGPGSPPPDSAGIRVVAPLGSGDMVLTDLNSDPRHLGNADGALFRIRSLTGQTEQMIMTDTLWVDPVAVEGYDSGRLLVADPRAGEVGEIYLVDYLLGTSERYANDPRLGTPNDLLTTRSGDLLVVDPFALLDPFGGPLPGVFVRRAGEQRLRVLSQGPPMNQPAQIAEDDRGRLWLVDRRALSHGPDPDSTTGAVFRIDPLSGAILDTLQFPAFRSPTGVVSWPDGGLLVVDEAASEGGTGTGLVFQIDPDLGTIRTVVADPRFRQPRTATLAPSGELWIVDRLARDETQAGSPRTLFLWDPELNTVKTVAASKNFSTPGEVFAFPGPNPRISSYTYEDLNGGGLLPGDELVVRARITNIGPVATLTSAYRDTLPLALSLDVASVQIDAGIVQTVENLNILFWSVDLPSGVSREISYHATVRQNVPQGYELVMRSHLRTLEGVHRIRRLKARFPVFYQEGYLYLADGDSDPFRLGNSPGALWKINLVTAAPIAMGSTRDLGTPILTFAMPTEEPNILMVDQNANPMGYRNGRGALWRWIPETVGFELIAADSTFRDPRSAVAASDHDVLLLDALADPFDLNERVATGPGAIYHIDIRTKEVTPFFSDTAFVAPRGIVLDGRGGLFIIDADADPGKFGMHNGAIFRLDLLKKELSIYSASADYRGPFSGTIGPDGNLYILDRDITAFETSEARGGIFRVDRFGNAVLFAASRKFRRVHSMAFDSHGRVLVSDNDADPINLGGPYGAVFRREGLIGEFQSFVSALRHSMPAGFFLREQVTPIDITDLAATPVGEGIRIEWQVAEAAFQGFLCLRALGEMPASDEDYAILNEENPVPGAGPWEYVDRAIDPGETYSYKIAALLPGGGMVSYGPVTATAAAWRPFAFLPPAPNPAKGIVTLMFDLPHSGMAEIRLYDLLGRRIRTVWKGETSPGRYTIIWDGRNEAGHPAATGLYIARLTWRDRSATRRILWFR